MRRAPGPRLVFWLYVNAAVINLGFAYLHIRRGEWGGLLFSLTLIFGMTWQISRPWRRTRALMKYRPRYGAMHNVRTGEHILLVFHPVTDDTLTEFIGKRADTEGPLEGDPREWKLEVAGKKPPLPEVNITVPFVPTTL